MSQMMVRRRRILIVDDDAAGRAALRAVLERSGHVVVMAENGDDGVELTRTMSPDVVLVAIGSPGLDGHRVAERIRATPDGRNPFLVALTGLIPVEAHRKAREAGFDTYVLKPADPGLLTALLAAPRVDVPSDRPPEIAIAVKNVEAPRGGSRATILGVAAMRSEHHHQLLLVDDDADFRATTVAVLKHAGYHAVGAHDGREALALLHDGLHPCVILLDLAMPEMDGFVFRRRQLADPSIADIPVFVVSGGGDVTEVDARRAGMDIFYRKPVDLTALVAAVAKYCRQAA